MISKKLSYEFVSWIVPFTTCGSIGVWSSSNVRGTFYQMYKKLSNETVSWSIPLTEIICGPHMCVMSTKCVRGAPYIRWFHEFSS